MQTSARLLSKSTKRRRYLEEVGDLFHLINNDTIENPPSTSKTSNVNDLQNSKNAGESCSNTNDFKSFGCNQDLSSGDIIINSLESSFSSDSDDCEFDNDKLFGNISSWAIKHNISNLSLSDLLKILRNNHKCFNSISIDARTLLKTNISQQPLKIRPMAPGFYHHFGLTNNLLRIIGHQVIEENNIKIVLGIDGLPLAKSSNSQFWPILCYIQNLNVAKPCVFLVGLYWGSQKPLESNDFLLELVNELKELSINGINLHTGKKNVLVQAICCDTPAKSYVLKIKGHTGFFSCTRCNIEGMYFENRGVYFPNTNFVKRTHEGFLNRVDEDYQIFDKISILTEIPRIDMVDSFPVDYMHSVCLGVVKKIISLWMGHLKKAPLPARLPSKKVNDISIRLSHLKSSMTYDFVRVPRELKEVLRWKATEFRTFILYTGPVVLKSMLKRVYYQHFLCLHVCLTVLLSHRFENLLDFIKDLLKYFVNKFGELYGVQFMSHNIHSLLHLCDDYKKFGSLDNCSCFIFENFMQFLKKMVRSKSKPLEQVIKRYEEYKMYGQPLNDSVVLDEIDKIFQKPHNDGPLIDGYSSPQFKIYSQPGIKINIKSSANSYIGINTNTNLTILKVFNICFDYINKKYVFLGKKFLDVKPFYEKPISSLSLGIACVNNLSDNYIPISIELKSVQKYIVFETYDFDFKVAFPILHS